MLTSPKELLSYKDDNGVLDEGDKAYFRARFRERAFSALLERFYEANQDSGVTRAAVAKRLQKNRSQVTRWLTEPSNLTLDALSDLLLAIGSEPVIETRKIGDEPVGNYYHPWSTFSPDRFSRAQSRVTTGSSFTEAVPPLHVISPNPLYGASSRQKQAETDVRIKAA